MKLTFVVAVLLQFLSFVPTVEAAVPVRVALTYTMSRNGTAAVELKEVLQHDGKTYALSSEGKAKGLLSLILRGSLSTSSRGAVSTDGLKPAEYRDQRGERTHGARFDYERRLIVLNDNGSSDTKPLASGTQDRLSVLYSFAFHMPGAAEFEIQVTDGRGVSTYRYANGGTETLRTPMGPLEAVHLVKRRDGPDDKTTELWLAREHHFLPVRMLIVEKDGTRIDQTISKIEY